MSRILALSLFVAAAAGDAPIWKPNWDMKTATAFMPCNYSGVWDDMYSAEWGLADYDWSDQRSLWENAHPMDCEARLANQAAQTKKASGGNTKVFVYRNLVKALPWFSSVREKINDPAYAGWFLNFRPDNGTPTHVPRCTGSKCSDLYHDQDQTPERCTGGCDCGDSIPCGEYLWDHRNASLREWLVNDFVLNAATGLGNDSIDGFYFDDGWVNHPEAQQPWMPKDGFCSTANAIGGPTEIEANCVSDMGLTQEDTDALTSNHTTTMNAVYAAITAKGGFYWQGFAGIDAPSNSSTCSAFFKAQCTGPKPNKYTNEALLVQFTANADGSIYPLPQPDFDVATFLAVRGPVGFIGHAWLGCQSGTGPPSSSRGQYSLPPASQMDYGQPVDPAGSCTETADGVFQREWTKATVSIDCNTYTSSITMKN